MKDNGIEDMHVEKTVVVSNTSSDLVSNATMGTTISKVIKENVRTLKKQVKELHGVCQLEQERNQLKDQLGT